MIKPLSVILLLGGALSAGNVNSNAPIHISGNAGFAGCGCANFVNGTWVIGPLSISSSNGDGVLIEGVTVPFQLQNLTVTKSKGAGIHLKGVTLSSPATVVSGTQTSLQNNTVGILVENSSELILDGGGSNPGGPGVAANGAGTINKNFSGAIDVESSSSITVKGFQMSANGQDGTPDWVSLDPGLANWGVGGVRFFNVTSSVIDHNAANNDTSISYSLFHSSGNQVTWNTADYPFTANIVVADGSSGNTVSHNQLGTADFIGILVADPLPGQPTTAYGSTANNTVSYNVVHSSGPTGTEIKAGISPDFLGGIVLLNSTSGNQIIGNQLSANSGTDLKWAGETLDPTSPIGVRSYPATAICNTGFAPFNGNFWSGNTFKKEDVCPGNIPLQ